jgi:hypothetical protein
VQAEDRLRYAQDLGEPITDRREEHVNVLFGFVNALKMKFNLKSFLEIL